MLSVPLCKNLSDALRLPAACFPQAVYAAWFFTHHVYTSALSILCMEALKH